MREKKRKIMIKIIKNHEAKHVSENFHYHCSTGPKEFPMNECIISHDSHDTYVTRC